MTDLDAKISALLIDRDFSVDERSAIDAVLALLGQRFLTLARQCGYLGDSTGNVTFQESALMVMELRYDLLGGSPPPSGTVIDNVRKIRAALTGVGRE